MSKIRKSARGQECQVRLPGVCNFNPETTVLAHIGGAGIGRKASDLHGAYCCSACHDVLDGRVKSHYLPIDLELAHYEGMVRTQEMLIEQGLIKIA